jgi:hypothetical protein
MRRLVVLLLLFLLASPPADAQKPKVQKQVITFHKHWTTPFNLPRHRDTPLHYGSHLVPRRCLLHRNAQHG